MHISRMPRLVKRQGVAAALRPFFPPHNYMHCQLVIRCGDHTIHTTKDEGDVDKRSENRARKGSCNTRPDRSQSSKTPCFPEAIIAHVRSGSIQLTAAWLREQARRGGCRCIHEQLGLWERDGLRVENLLNRLPGKSAGGTIQCGGAHDRGDFFVSIQPRLFTPHFGNECAGKVTINSRLINVRKS